MLLYDHPRSGNCHKVRLLLSMLGLPYEARFVDVPNGGHRQAWFGAINPLEQIPVLEDGDVRVQDSQAILVYLAKRYGPCWLPGEPVAAARVMEWLSFAAKEIALSLQVARLHHILDEETDIVAATAASHRVLRLMNAHLATRAFLAGDRASIADLACFPYVALSHEARIDHGDYPAVAAWVQRIVDMDGYVAMEGLPPARRQTDDGTTREMSQ
ncbi:glutathione S-transferase family protein [Phreatobacter sp. AB_2022a]|uniref:glutathione S-transferase family protein n=1 Tax=Phreatobacter sp. AB_2022a TaxID=3003134 RepID=UPI00228766CA|nr:glutathione S-transferase family protein [Phreatobacter sp. AB_2022a]MCZ0733936.1 glutathione S-transferase family protein [Phreatobacter sp. AB_2022a]